MSIMTRFFRLCKADLHGVLDQLEDKGLILNQCLRDMESQIGRKEAKLKQMLSARSQTERDVETRIKEREKLEQDLNMAIEKDRDDIARILIKKIKPLGHHLEHMQAHLKELDNDIGDFRTIVEEQKHKSAALQLRAKEYFRHMEKKEWQQADQVLASATAGNTGSEPTDEEVELELLRRKELVKGGSAQ